MNTDTAQMEFEQTTKARTQAQRVLNVLADGMPHHTGHFISFYPPILRSGAVIFRLRERGYHIVNIQERGGHNVGKMASWVWMVKGTNTHPIGMGDYIKGKG